MTHENACPNCERLHSIHTKTCCTCQTRLVGYTRPCEEIEIIAARKGGNDLSEVDAIRQALEGEPVEILALLVE